MPVRGERRGPTLSHLPRETLRLMDFNWTKRTIRAVRAAGRWGTAWHRLEGADPSRIRRWVHRGLLTGQARVIADNLQPMPAEFEGRRWLELARLCADRMTDSPDKVVMAVLDLACRSGASRPHYYCSEERVEVLSFGSDVVVPADLSLMPPVERLFIKECPLMQELPALPGQVSNLVINGLPCLERLPDVPPPDRLLNLRVIGNPRLRIVPRVFVDRAARTVVFASNNLLEELPLMRQRRGRAIDSTPPSLEITRNQRLCRLPPSFASGWRVDLLAVTENPRIQALPPWFGAGVRARRVVVSENNSLVWVNTGFLRRAQCQRLKLTDNPMLSHLPDDMDLVVRKMTVADSSRLTNLPHDLGRRGAIAHLKVHSNTALRSVWPTRAVFSGLLEVYENDALRIIAPKLTFGEAPADPSYPGGRGLRVRDNPNLVCLAQVLDGRLPGELHVHGNASLSTITTGTCIVAGLRRVEVAHNEQLESLPTGLLHDTEIGSIRVTHNPRLRSLGSTDRLRVSGDVHVCDNDSLPMLVWGGRSRVGGTLEVGGNRQLVSLVIDADTHVGGQLLVRGNSALTELSIGETGPPVRLGSLWVVDNSALRQAFTGPIQCEVEGDMVIVRNLKLRYLSPREFSFAGHVRGDLVVSENARLRTIHPAVLAAARGGVHVVENARLKTLPGGWADGLQLTAKVRIINNPMLVTIGDVVDVRAYGGFKVVNNRALQQIAVSMLRVSAPAGNVQISFNERMQTLAGGSVEIQAEGSCIISQNPRMTCCTDNRFTCVSQRDLFLEYNPQLETLGPDAALKAGKTLVLQQNGKLKGVDASATPGVGVKLSRRHPESATLAEEAWGW